MFQLLKKNKLQENKLYNKILSLSRNKLFYTKLGLSDTFQNRIILIFLHISFLFVKLKKGHKIQHYKEFYQRMFNIVFKQIELNMREIGYGDMTVSKNMKFLVTSFYNILLSCENYRKKSSKNKGLFLIKYLDLNDTVKSTNNNALVAYFDTYEAFSVDLNLDSVLKGDLNFNYR